MAKHIHIHLVPTRTADRKAKDASRRYNVEIRLPDGSKKVEKLEFPAGKEGGYGGVIKYEIQKRYPGASVLGIIERGDSMKDASFPANLEHKGKKFVKTGKMGKSFANGEETAEYEAVNTEGKRTSERLWLSASGKKTEDAGFSRREYSPREWNRLQDEIKEVEAKIKATKGPFSKRDLEQVLAKLKAEQGKYRTDDSSTKGDLEDEIDEVSEKIERFKDKGVQPPADLIRKLKDLQAELKKLNDK